MASGRSDSATLPELRMKPGTYTGKAKGYHGTVVVETLLCEFF
jgi:hypothetical protein